MIGTSAKPRLSVFRSNMYIYAQLIDDKNSTTLGSVSDKKLPKTESKTKVEKASSVGELIASEAKKHKITNVIFDRGSYKYHGRVKALAEAARKGGLNF